MKRELLCAACGETAWRPIPISRDSDPFEVMERHENEESVWRVNGVARSSFWCDACGAPVRAGASAVAVSVSTRRAPYFQWEDNVLEVNR